MRAKYKDPVVLTAVEDWWELTSKTLYPHNPKRERSMTYLYYEFMTQYLSEQIQSYAVLGMDFTSFGRALYSLGVVNVIPGDDISPTYKRLPDWRPSADQVARFQPPLERAV